MSTPRPVLILAAIAAGGSAATGVLSTAEGVPGWVTLTLALLTAVATAVGAVVVQGQVTPNAKIATLEPRPNVFVAGDAGPVPKGERVEPPVSAEPSPYRGRDDDLRPPQDPPYDDGHGVLQRRRDLDAGDWHAWGTWGTKRLEHGQITGTVVVVMILISAAVAVVVYAIAARV